MGVGRNLRDVHQRRDSAFEKLSSGTRIVRSADDAAGLAVSENLRAGVRSLQMATRNSNDGISVVQAAEAGIQEVQSVLTRLRELSVQAASDTLGDAERQMTNIEFQALKSEIQRFAQTTTFNGRNLLNGLGGDFEVQVGIDNSATNDRIRFDAGMTNVTTANLGLSGLHLATKDMAAGSLRPIDQAVDRLSLYRAYLGSVQASLASNAENMTNHRIHLSEADSQVRDTEFAKESSVRIQQDIIANAGGAVLVQANQISRQALTLLGSKD
jgi:flagellin